MKDYYIDNLSGNHLHRVYQLADDAVKNYLQGEIDYFKSRIKPGDRVLELGCGYGRIIKEIAEPSHHTVGIDNAPGNLDLARAYLHESPNVDVQLMSVDKLGFPDKQFDLVLCTQNGLSAFGLDPLIVINEALRVTSSGGCLLCCTYADLFWPARLAWFRRQSDAGLLGPIDEDSTGNRAIVCRDGFVSRSMTHQQFEELAEAANASVSIEETPTGSLIAALQGNR